MVKRKGCDCSCLTLMIDVSCSYRALGFSKSIAGYAGTANEPYNVIKFALGADTGEKVG